MVLLGAARYDHAEWFFGTGSHPRWLDCTPGYQMVGRWLVRTGPIDAAARVQVPAATVIASAFEEGLVSQAT